MDFTLKSLRSVFEDENSIKKTYKLYMFILATVADKNIFPGILSFSSELNYSTGSDILICGPQVYGAAKTLTTEDLIEVFNTGLIGKEFGHEIPRNVSTILRDFVNVQTRETHGFLKFIQEDLSILPAIVFFENINRPKDYLVWNLDEHNPSSFIKKFRLIISELDEKCGWAHNKKIEQLENEIYRLNQCYPYYSLENKLSGLQKELNIYYLPAKIIEEYRKKLIKGNEHYCLENSESIFYEFEQNPWSLSVIEKIGRFRKRWKSKIPVVLNALIKEYLVYRNEKHTLFSQQIDKVEMELEILKLEDEIQEVVEKKSKSKILKKELKKIKMDYKENYTSPLKVLQAMNLPRTAVGVTRPALNLSNTWSSAINDIKEKMDRGFNETFNNQYAINRTVKESNFLLNNISDQILELSGSISNNLDLINLVDSRPVDEFHLTNYYNQINNVINKLATLNPILEELKSIKELKNKLNTAADIKGKFKITWSLLPEILTELAPIPNIKYEKEISFNLKDICKQIIADFKEGNIFTKPIDK